MTKESTHLLDPRIQQALGELRGLIAARYPTATFEVFHRDDPEGVRLRATVDVEDTDEVMDLVMDKLYHIQVEQELPVYVVTAQPLERVGRQLHQRRRKHDSPRPLRIALG